MRILNPRSSGSRIPLLVIDREIKFGFYLQANLPWGYHVVAHPRPYFSRRNRTPQGPYYTPPFGLYIQVPFIWARWGCA